MQLILRSLISPRDASNKRSNGPPAPCTTSQKFENSWSPACAWLAYGRSEPPCSRDPEGLLGVDLSRSMVFARAAGIGATLTP
jgi:hypothetical protein